MLDFNDEAGEEILEQEDSYIFSPHLGVSVQYASLDEDLPVGQGASEWVETNILADESSNRTANEEEAGDTGTSFDNNQSVLETNPIFVPPRSCGPTNEPTQAAYSFGSSHVRSPECWNEDDCSTGCGQKHEGT